MPDWHLSRAVAHKLFTRLGYPQVDLIATSNSNQVDQYFSALIDNGTAGIDAFTKNWDQFFLAYIFPPPPMVELQLYSHYSVGNVHSVVPQSTQAGNSASNETPSLMEHRGGHGRVRMPSNQQQGRQDQVRRLEAFRIRQPQLEICPLGLSKLFS